MIPADPVAMIAGRNATAETREQIRHQLGLDRPLPVQYLDLCRTSRAAAISAVPTPARAMSAT